MVSCATVTEVLLSTVLKIRATISVNYFIKIASPLFSDFFFVVVMYIAVHL